MQTETQINRTRAIISAKRELELFYLGSRTTQTAAKDQNERTGLFIFQTTSRGLRVRGGRASPCSEKACLLK